MGPLLILKNLMGSQVAMARGFGVSETAVHKWMKKGFLPPIRAIQAQNLSGGEIKAVEFINEAMEIKNDGKV